VFVSCRASEVRLSRQDQRPRKLSDNAQAKTQRMFRNNAQNERPQKSKGKKRRKHVSKAKISRAIGTVINKSASETKIQENAQIKKRQRGVGNQRTFGNC